LHAPLGTYAVLGNHDWWVDAATTRAALEARNIPVLENDAGVITLADGSTFWLAGLGDQLAFKGTGRGIDDLAGLTARIPDDGRAAILLAHEPDIFPQLPARFGLTLSGHTHGGQVRLPFLGRYPVSAEHGQRYCYGHIVEGGRHLVVSGGLGCSGLPVRLGVPPEINLITVARQTN
jgi:predicted MPP superfamily phosphohydrolase